MSDETAFEKLATLGQLKEIIATLIQAVPTRLSSDEAQHIIENKGWLLNEMHKLFALQHVQSQIDIGAQFATARAGMMVTDSARGIARQKEEWAQFYRDVFEITVDYRKVKVPEWRSGFDRLIVVAQGLTLKRIIEVARKYFSVDVALPSVYCSCRHARLPERTYAIWVRDHVDSDEKFTNVDPDGLWNRGVQSITVLEHLLFHLKYYRETGQFLDRNGRRTLCAGSCDSRNFIPVICVIKSGNGDKCLGLGLGFGTGPYSTREVIA
jgi:hypothetical protein